MKMKREEERVSDLSLEQYRLGELAPAAAAALAERLGRDPALVARLEHLAASDAEILAAHPPAEVAAAIRGRARGARGAPFRGGCVPSRFTSLALPAAAAVLLTLSLLLVRERLLADGDGVRLKGAATALSAWRKVGEGAERLADGSRGPGRRRGAALVRRGRCPLRGHLLHRRPGRRHVPPPRGLGGRDFALARARRGRRDHARLGLRAGRRPVVRAILPRLRRSAVLGVERRGRGPSPRRPTRRGAAGQLGLPRALRQAAFLLVKER